jgi:hypothetical protein
LRFGCHCEEVRLRRIYSGGNPGLSYCHSKPRCNRDEESVPFIVILAKAGIQYFRIVILTLKVVKGKNLGVERWTGFSAQAECDV